MNETRRTALVALVILLLLVGGLYLLFWPKTASEPLAAAPVDSALTQAPVEVAAEGEPAPEHHAMPSVPADGPLPELASSDGPWLAALDQLLEPAQRAAALVSEQLIRRMVATVDSLPRARLASNDRAFKRVPGTFMAHSRDGAYSLNPGNEARYVSLVGLLKAAGAEPSAQLYLRYYPLFEKAYRELGHPSHPFNDRLVQVIDHLLATPEVPGPIALVQPRVMYEFADPTLESRSVGQKMMIRMGPVNQQQVKQWLRAFRAQVIDAQEPQA